MFPRRFSKLFTIKLWKRRLFWGAKIYSMGSKNFWKSSWKHHQRPIWPQYWGEGGQFVNLFLTWGLPAALEPIKWILALQKRLQFHNFIVKIFENHLGNITNDHFDPNFGGVNLSNFFDPRPPCLDTANRPSKWLRFSKHARKKTFLFFIRLICISVWVPYTIFGNFFILQSWFSYEIFVNKVVSAPFSRLFFKILYVKNVVVPPPKAYYSSLSTKGFLMMGSVLNYRGTISLDILPLWKSKNNKVVYKNFWKSKFFLKKFLLPWSLHNWVDFQVSSAFQFGTGAISKKKIGKSEFLKNLKIGPKSALGATRPQLLYHKVSLLGTTPYHPIWFNSVILPCSWLIYPSPKSSLKWSK